jgi:hypothetical protein
VGAVFVRAVHRIGPLKKRKEKTMKNVKEYTREEWIAEGERLFGSLKENFMRWRFKCPACGNIATVAEFKDAGALCADEATVKCIGRYTRAKGCDWAAYGLLDICSVRVDGRPVFEFAPYEENEVK